MLETLTILSLVACAVATTAIICSMRWHRHDVERFRTERQELLTRLAETIEGLQKTHNSLTQSVATIDQKVENTRSALELGKMQMRRP
jgi:hypothetical protein